MPRQIDCRCTCVLVSDVGDDTMRSRSGGTVCGRERGDYRGGGCVLCYVPCAERWSAGEGARKCAVCDENYW